MKIRLTPPQPESPSFEIDHQLALALATLHDAAIRVRGAGRFGRNIATILLEGHSDIGKALNVLRSKGIEGRPEFETAANTKGTPPSSNTIVPHLRWSNR